MPALGNKHECIQCGVKFYDLGKSRAVCPSCGADQSEAEKQAEAAVAAPASTVKAAAKPASSKVKSAGEPSEEAAGH